jgi:hypothetical protein
MMASGDILNYDYMASHNFIRNGFNFNTVGYDPNNVNYDSINSSANPVAWAQNIANGFYDPRPPVFIKTNASANSPADFRFWVDLNRNGKFETNGFLPVIKDNGLQSGAVNYFNGEPEWIGVRQYPESPLSATNRYIGRYAYVVQPTGKMLDFNYIHNYSKVALGGKKFPPVMQLGEFDEFVRDQGVGSWELNLAGYLWGLNDNIYGNATAPYFATPYNYAPGQFVANRGYAFDDAYSFLRFRYADDYAVPYPSSLASNFPAPYYPYYTPNYLQDGIDEFGTQGFFATASYPGTNAPWPGGYSLQNFYNIQDVFDPNKTSQDFANRLLTNGFHTNSYDRYTFQRLLATIGTGSVPELQTYVFDDPPRVWNPNINNYPNNYPNPDPTRLRTKVNLNYDNTYQIVNGLNTSPTVLIPWTSETNGALGFFTNAAESLLRSQEFATTNYSQNYPSNIVYLHFGLTNIPIYNSTNPSIRYSEKIHRLLQLAANIYDASRTNNTRTAANLPNPSVFRPVFFTNGSATNRAIYIGGYIQVTNDAFAQMMQEPFVDFTDAADFNPNCNLWGIPWVVGAVKGLPAFDRYVSGTSWTVTRKLLFKRQLLNGSTNLGDPTQRPAYTNQFLIMSISNSLGMDAWNAYSSNITSPFTVIASNYVSIVLTNNSASKPGGFVTNFATTTNYSSNFWRAAYLSAPPRTNGMLAFLQTNPVPLPPSYFSEANHAFVPVHVDPLNPLGYTSGSFLPGDLTQTAWPVYGWTLTVTNRVMYALVDPVSERVLDFVNLGPFGTNYNLTNLLSQAAIGGAPSGGIGSANAGSKYWLSTYASAGLASNGVIGVSNQIANGVSYDTNFAAALNPNATNNTMAFSNQLYFSCSNNPVASYPNPVNTALAHTLLANDPLVHYTVGDLTPPTGDSTQILTINDRYEPWPTPSSIYLQNIRANMTFKDPQITNSDAWSFPNNKFPSIGWLGRVHRGTPWQTIFLKADNNTNVNPYTWTRQWVSTLDTYPTNDYALLDLFTAAPNDNASRGLLSVNQTDDAPWYALFSGIILNTNITYPPAYATSGPNLVLDPTNVAPLLNGINATRSLEPDGLFHSMGSVFKSAILTIDSPFLPAGVGAYNDEEVEAIPQAVAGLLKLGQPRFVIYAYGQALKPKDIYFGSSPATFNLCTNYQITGEFVIRTVCHIVGDPAATSLRIQVDSSNILPAD